MYKAVPEEKHFLVLHKVTCLTLYHSLQLDCVRVSRIYIKVSPAPVVMKTVIKYIHILFLLFDIWLARVQ